MRPDHNLVCDLRVSIVLSKPNVRELIEAVRVLRDWQYEGAPMQLHPGDLGWFWRHGADATAAAIRIWSRDGRILAIGFLDEPKLLRMTMAPDARKDEQLARRLVSDLAQPQRGVLNAGEAYVEAPMDALIQQVLAEDGWSPDEAWTPLRRDLDVQVEDPGVRIDVVGREQAHVRTAVHRAAFPGSTFTVERWESMTEGPQYADARCLVAYDGEDNAVAAVTVWSAGAGKPGLLEPMGVHHEHRGHGYGTAMNVAAAAELQRLGSSCAIVCTPSSNVGGVAAYKSAGYQPRPEVRDLRRDAAAC